MQTRLTRIQEDHEQVVRTLESQVREARVANEQREVELAKVRDELASKTRIYEDLCASHETLERQLADMRAQWDTDLEKRVREREDEFVVKLSAMDERLNEARREQAKAAVMVRQVERSGSREKERLETLLKSCDAYYKEHLTRLQDKVRSLEKERNTLATSLRQHGVNSLSQVDQSNLSSKSPLGFFDRDSNARNWLETNRASSSRPPVNPLKPGSSGLRTDATSFWLDSNLVGAESMETGRNENEMTMNEAAAGATYVETNEDDDPNSLKLASSGNNVEILQQIRKIMGDLELSDDEEEDDEDFNERDENQTGAITQNGGLKDWSGLK